MADIKALYLSVRSQGGTVNLFRTDIGPEIRRQIEQDGFAQKFVNTAWSVDSPSLKGQQFESRIEEERLVPIVRDINLVLPSGTIESQDGAKRRAVGSVSVHRQVTSWKKEAVFRRYLTGFTLEGKIDADRSFFGSFWQEGQTLKYYLVIQFPDSFARELFDGVYVPELMECRLTKLRVLVFSHATMAFQHGWDAGVHFLSDFQFGRNLQRAVSIDNQVFFGGKLTLVEDRINFDLMSWPEFTFTMGGGKIVIENGRVQARVRESVDEELWEDDDANIEGQDADEIPPDDGSPNPLDAQVSLSGRLQAGEAPKLPVWTPLPPDSGAVCWQLNPPPVVCSSNQLATFLGPDWDSRFSLKPVTYDCRSLAITVNLETGRLSDVTCEIAMPTFDINGVCPKTLTIAPAAVTAQANFPFDEEHRTLTIEVEGDTRPSADTAGLALSANYSLLESELTLTVPDESLPDTWKSMYWLRGVGLPDRGYDALSIVWSPTSCRAYLSGDELDLDMEAKK